MLLYASLFDHPGIDSQQMQPAPTPSQKESWAVPMQTPTSWNTPVSSDACCEQSTTLSDHRWLRSSAFCPAACMMRQREATLPSASCCWIPALASSTGGTARATHRYTTLHAGTIQTVLSSCCVGGRTPPFKTTISKRRCSLPSEGLVRTPCLSRRRQQRQGSQRWRPRQPRWPDGPAASHHHSQPFSGLKLLTSLHWFLPVMTPSPSLWHWT